MSAPDAEARDLLGAVSRALKILGSGGDESLALEESFELAARGMRAEKAVLLRVADTAPLRLEVLQSWGMSPEQVRACAQGGSVPGVSPSTIRCAVDTRSVQLVENAQLRSAGEGTASLAGAPHSVLCAPVLDPWTGSTLAVVYFQTVALMSAYRTADVHFMESYATALGHAFGYHFSTERRYRELEAEWKRRSGDDAPEIVGDSEAIWRLRELLHTTYLPQTTLRNPAPVLVLGATGVGKDQVAQYLHHFSPVRRKAKYVVVNCATLRGSEVSQAILFGHTRGAFTGAIEAKPGAFRAAHAGTLFLDEIAELPLEAQGLLLRVLGSWRVLPLGATDEVAVDVQVIAATNRDIQRDVKEGRFREDLYQRIKPLTIRLPSLASRPGDIPPLLRHCLAREERRAQKRLAGLSREAMTALLAYHWPGNVRELEGVCKALVTFARPGQEIGLSDLREYCELDLPAGTPPASTETGSLHEARAQWERSYLVATLEGHAWNLPVAAKDLGISLATLYRYLKAHGLRQNE
jgi:DNA-binding NtrC family response regulator